MRGGSWCELDTFHILQESIWKREILQGRVNVAFCSFSFPVRKEFLQLLDEIEGLEGRADGVHSLTAVVMVCGKTIVRSDRLFRPEESHLVSHAICCCMSSYRQIYQDFSSSCSHSGNCVRVVRLPPAGTCLFCPAFVADVAFGAYSHLHMFHEYRNFSPAVPAIRNGGTEAVNFSKSLGNYRTKTHDEVRDTIRRVSMLHNQGAMD